MARKKKVSAASIVKERQEQGLNQRDYWAQYGVTQSGGSRYESGRDIPKPLSILMALAANGKVSKKDLLDAQK